MGYMGLGFMWFFWLILIGVIVWIMLETQRPKQLKLTPLGIAKRRYAKGEITKKEFDDMKKELE